MKQNISIFIGVFLFVMLGNSIYMQITKEPQSAKAKRIPCQKKVTSFERGFGDKDIKIAQEQLQSGNFYFTSTIEKPIYMESKLFEYVKLNDMDKIVQISLNSYIKKKNIKKEKLKISYNIYENDIKDPGKKTKKSKLYAGYTVFKFYNKNNKVIYQVQIDFIDKKGADLPQRIKCSIKSFATYNK